VWKGEECFLEATVYFQDEIFTRVCDLHNEHSVFGAELYYHSKCMRKYLRTYEYVHSTPDKTKLSKKRQSFDESIKYIDGKVLSGETFDLSKRITGQSKLTLGWSRNEVRLLWFNHYGAKLTFLKAAWSASTIFFIATKGQTMEDTHSSKHSIYICAETIRNALLNCGFELLWCSRFEWIMYKKQKCQNRYLDSWEFFVTEENKYHSSSTNNSISLNRKMKMGAIFQILDFNVHNGSRRTPLHLVNSQVTHEKCKHRDLITSLKYLACPSFLIQWTATLPMWHGKPCYWPIKWGSTSA